MNRIIRFRGKDKATGKWVFGDLTHTQGITPAGSEKLTYPRVMVAGYEVDEETVGQYTGMDDMNGKPVYEGDYIKYQDSEKCYPVLWNDGGFYIDCEDAGLMPLYHGRFEVVGNRFELKGGNQ